MTLSRSIRFRLPFRNIDHFKDMVPVYFRLKFCAGMYPIMTHFRTNSHPSLVLTGAILTPDKQDVKFLKMKNHDSFLKFEPRKRRHLRCCVNEGETYACYSMSKTLWRRQEEQPGGAPWKSKCTLRVTHFTLASLHEAPLARW